MKIGIYGGTFDPPHLGHMEAAKAAIHYFGLDRLLLIPNKLPPHKFLPKDTASEGARLAMTELMADGIGPTATALNLELLREGPSYTADTIRALRTKYPEDQFYLLMGTDMFLSFETWREPDFLAKEVTLVPFFREEGSSHELFAVQTEKLREALGAKIQMLPLETVHPISSSQVRRLLHDEETQDRAGSLLFPSVYGYILRHGLYGTNTELKNLSASRLRAVSYSMMKAKRIAHVRGTEETAVALALLWGEPPEYARRAAILHDCTKYWELPEQLALCAEYGVSLDDLERQSVKMLHSKTAAILAEHQFGEAPEVCRAIAHHTTGAPDMTRFDQIIYLADYVEPTRDFDGVEELRQLAFSNLEKAMMVGLQTTIAELEEKHVPVHTNTIRTLEQLKRIVEG